MEKALLPNIPLTSVFSMPVIGLGTGSYPPADRQTIRVAVLDAIKAGYRHFDTASIYQSEHAIGDAIVEAVEQGFIKSRHELFITSKLWACDSVAHLVLPAIKASLRNLKLEYLDLYLIHWPLRISKDAKSVPLYEDDVYPLDIKSVWEAMEECQDMGLTKAIGVSNFSCKKLTELLTYAKIRPAVNQVELSPAWHQKELLQFCKANDIHVTAYSPLGASGTKWGDNRVLESQVLQEIAEAKGKSVAQVAMRWVYEQGVSVVAKSFNAERMRRNLEIFDWSLSKDECEKIDQLPQSKGVLFVNTLGRTDLALELDAEI